MSTSPRRIDTGIPFRSEDAAHLYGDRAVANFGCILSTAFMVIAGIAFTASLATSNAFGSMLFSAVLVFLTASFLLFRSAAQKRTRAGDIAITAHIDAIRGTISAAAGVPISVAALKERCANSYDQGPINAGPENAPESVRLWLSRGFDVPIATIIVETNHADVSA